MTSTPQRTPEWDAYIKEQVAKAPPLSPRQREQLSLLLAPKPSPEQEARQARTDQILAQAHRELHPVVASSSRYIPKAVRAEILSEPCDYCGGIATQVDHVVPLSRGGLHRRENWAPSCANCNFDKADLLLSEWRR